jgi:hypothetical protein
VVFLRGQGPSRKGCCFEGTVPAGDSTLKRATGFNVRLVSLSLIPNAIAEGQRTASKYAALSARWVAKQLYRLVRNLLSHKPVFDLADRLLFGAKPDLCIEGRSMSTFEAFLLGLMAAWTPLLLLLAWILGHPRVADSEDQSCGLHH